MAKIKLTVQELKNQRAELQRYQRFLPTLTLKKLQLQIEVNRVRQEEEALRQEEAALRGEFDRWIAVLGEEAGVTELLKIESVETGTGSIAGVEIPLFEGLRFSETAYDLYAAPLWLDSAVEVLRRLLTMRAEMRILRRQMKLLEEEMRTTVQRVNLFEKVKIPETHENIRKIQIFLADQQTAAVVRGKISKSKLGRRTSV